MREARCFKCDYCDKFYGPADVVRAHEAAHFKLSVADYQTWKKLDREAVWEQRKHATIQSPVTERRLEAATKALEAFKKEHGLSGKALIDNQM